MKNGIHESSISVAVRVRPFTEAELRRLSEYIPGPRPVDNAQLASSAPPVVTPAAIRRVLRVVDEKMLVFDPADEGGGRHCSSANPRAREHRFVFDRLLDETAGQVHTYEATARPLIDSVLDGYNSTVFAYGATGCGKTHTIVGPESDPGVVFLATRELYDRLEARTDKPSVTMSYLEIYNETVRDLLNPTTTSNRLVIRENAGGKMTVANLASHAPGNVDEVMQLIAIGNQNRTCAATDANAVSSRSHAVLQLTVTTGTPEDTTDANSFHVTSATFTFVDLAGSERAAASSNRGTRLHEGANINRSLLALGNCINALCDPRRHKHVPYRDSKLTRLLKFSLGGNCRTVMIACVSPSSHHYDETLNTLKYADRAKHISTKVVRNRHTVDRHVGTLRATVMAQQREINRLRLQLGQLETSGKNPSAKRSSSAILASVDHEHTSQTLKNLWSQINSSVESRRRKCTLLAQRSILFRHRLQASFLAEKIQHLPDKSVLISLVATIDKTIAMLESQYNTPDETDELFAVASQVDPTADSSPHWHEFHRSVVQLAHQNYSGIVVQKASVFLESLLCAAPHLVCSHADTDFATEFINTVSDFVGGKHDHVIKNHAQWFFSQSQHQTVQPPVPPQKPLSRRRKSIRMSSAEKRVRWEFPDQSDRQMDKSIDKSMDPSDFSPDGSEVGSPKAPFDELDLSFDPSLSSPPLSAVLPEQLNKTLAVNKVRKPGRIPLTARKLPTSDTIQENSDSIEEAVSSTPVHSPGSPRLGPPTRAIDR
ncbi:hypothetical protein PGUG_02005 [Meyerozyma guilliermondii ATCC 6260]|uniref:Kinesin-like protein n=1 Tax=Meyerozyma guilliermondii (strain ATCC 6260 / CBS 566 / DSM 6381 / JCM 1539 / NBRC 10279 / NRRL Y-324) TaxID=294746 RepID=A5DFF4_PICGU|nr:uncharacterized protein PGUG_02005 [Meyerozyma guilliermondii ATCC 6260]EDK37907.2 hypothetical protein PGUG_02005 [Meyerozyma guilliermondii ATCC 6260]